jgi:hypothetical protein
MTVSAPGGTTCSRCSPDWSPQIDEARDIGDAVLVRVRAEASGTGSGIPLERDYWQAARVWELKWWAFVRTEEEPREARHDAGT